jgi:beta-glucosidase
MARARRSVLGCSVALLLAVAMLAGSPARSGAAPAHPWLDSHLSPARRAHLLLDQMTLEEKVALMTSDTGAPYAYYNAPIPRLGIPALKMADAGSGVAPRGWSLPGTGGKATAMPSEIALGATFSARVARRYGAVVAEEVRATGQNVLLGPDADIAREPWFGRISESEGEDPRLNGTLDAAYVKALQSRHVIATLKHYAGYNQEVDRNIGQNSVIGQRALHEVYTLAFETVVRQAHLGAVMCSYNKINGAYSCQNELTNRRLLKGRIGFTGFVLTDFGALHDTLAGLKAGTDMETGTTTVYDGALLAAVRAGQASQTQVDEACLRILRTMFRVGVFDTDYSTHAIPVARHDLAARRIEDQAITLLKDDGVLPLTGASADDIALIGADADTIAAEGGSAYVDPTTTTTTLAGLRARAGQAAVSWTPGNDPVNGASMIETSNRTTVPSSVLTDLSGDTGLTTSYWHTPDFAGAPAVTRTERQVSYDVGFPTTFPNWAGAGSSVPVPPTDFFLEQQSVRYDGYLTAPMTGRYVLSLTGWGDATMTLDGRRVIDMTGHDGRRVVEAAVDLRAGSRYRVHIEYRATRPVSPLQPGTLLLQWKPPSGTRSPAIDDAVAAARAARVAVVFVRTFESEERDRVSLKLPQSSNQLIRAVAAANPRTVVVLASGGPVTMPWLPHVAGVVQTYFGGQAQGAALADVLFGDVDPQGRLPVTYPTSDSAAPVANPWSHLGDLDVHYTEGVDVGYRGYEKSRLTPLFPFGYGLSYTSFAYARPASHSLVSVDGAGAVHVAFRVRNTGSRAGTDTPQVYLRLPAASGERSRRLAEVAKVRLPAHTARTVRLTLHPHGATHPLDYWDTARDRWVTPTGRYKLYVGSSARDAELTGTFHER